MKKFIVLLLAALMIVGLCVSCKEDPKPDAFKGTWKGTDSDGWEHIIECDGFGKVTYTQKKDDASAVFSGTYQTSGEYVSMTFEGEKEEGHSYFYLHEITAADVSVIPVYTDDDIGKFAIHTSDESEECVFPDDYEEEEIYARFTKDGADYNATVVYPYDERFVEYRALKAAAAATASGTHAVYKEDYDPDAENELLCSETFTQQFACTEGGASDPWNFKFDNCSGTELEMKSQYKLTSTTLTINVEAGDDVESLELIKQ